jgi:hypothetical protein
MQHRPALLAILLAACGGSSGGNGDDSSTTPDANTAAPDAYTPVGVAAIPLSSPDGEFYTAQTTIGSQQFAMVVDTGSGSAAVAGASCTNCNVTPTYAPGPTATDDHQNANAQYGSGSWTGKIYTDQTGLGGGTPPVSLKLASISSQMTFFDGNQNLFQGILGLGGDGTLTAGTTSYVDAVVAAGVTDVLSFELCDGGGGTMWVGGYDPSAASASPQYTAMNTALPYYMVQLDNLTLGGQSVGYQSSLAIADTGTSLFYVPSAVASATLAKVNAATDLFIGPFQSVQGIECGMAKSGVTGSQIDATLPPLELTFKDGSNTPFTVSSPATRSYMFDAGQGQWCVGLADNSSVGLPITILGDMGLRGFVSVFDLAHHQIGFAPDQGCATAHKPERAAATPLRERGHLPRL